jgi:hypothetical protein
VPYVSLTMDRDIFRGQAMKAVASGVVLHIDSWDLHDKRFFVENDLESLFYSLSPVVSFSTQPFFKACHSSMN